MLARTVMIWGKRLTLAKNMMGKVMSPLSVGAQSRTDKTDERRLREGSPVLNDMKENIETTGEEVNATTVYAR